MSGRYRTVALQAVGVAVIAAFVFVAFLRPSEPEDLAGIEAPGGGDGPSVVNPEPDDEKKKGEKKNGKHQNGPKGDGRNDGPRAGGSARPGTSAPTAPGDVGTDIPPGGGDGPPDDQYTDLVSLLMKQVGQPGLFKEIDGP